MGSFSIRDKNCRAEKACDSTSLIFSCNSFQECLDKIKRTRLPSNRLPLFHLMKFTEKRSRLAAEFESASSMSQGRFKFRENRAYFYNQACETELFFKIANELIEKSLLTSLSIILCGKLCKPNIRRATNKNLIGFCHIL